MQIREILKKIYKKETLKTIYLNARFLLLKPLSILIPKKRLNIIDIRNILFLRHDRVGDMVLSLPAIRLLKKAFPYTSLTVLASVTNKDILLNNPYVDRVMIYHDFASYIREMRHERFDLAIDPFMTYELKPALMTILSGAKYRIGIEWAGRQILFPMDCPEYSPEKSFTEMMMELLLKMGIKPDNFNNPLILLTPDEKKEASSFLQSIHSNKRLVAIHPGAYYPSQRWHLDRFIDVARDISKNGWTCLFFIHGKEFPQFDDSVFKDEHNIHIIKQIPLRKFISILSLCELLVCNNSGPLHIAAELKIKTVSVMGPTVPAVWWPKGKGHIVIRKDYPCSPCNKAICEDHKCMNDISVEEVLEKVYQFLAGKTLPTNYSEGNK
ncbi:MAG: glycosyltransferase family 9 protein [Deltaproteobacteria bacterium]|nr:glycosyltransferase family 9 protein [Deltaproteobacteria bacterium]